jgi:hypothetical protein
VRVVEVRAADAGGQEFPQRFTATSARRDLHPRSRGDRTGINDPWALTYPEQVKIALLLTRPTFLRAATDPDISETQHHALTTSEIEKIIPTRGDADPWRAINRVRTAVTHLTDRRRDARIYGVPIRDTYYNMLRLI